MCLNVGGKQLTLNWPRSSPTRFSCHFTRTTLCWHGISCHRVSVRPSVPQSVRHKPVLYQNGYKRGISKNNAAHDSPGTLIVWCKKISIYEIPTASSSTGAPNAGGVGKNCVFRPVEKSPAQTLYRRKFVSIRHGRCVHDGSLADEYAVSSTTLVSVEIWCSQLRFSWHQQDSSFLGVCW